MKYYSPSTRGFYDPTLHGERDDPETKIPADAIEITENKYERLLEAQREGKEIEPGEDGAPVARARVFTKETIRDEVFPELRAKREVILNRLTGVMLDAFLNGENEKLSAAAAQRQRLLDLTEDPDLLAVPVSAGPAGLRDAVIEAFRTEAREAPEDLQDVFRGVVPEE